MSFAFPFRLPALSAIPLFWVGLALLAASAVVVSFHRQPRVWLPAETPVAFWAWRTQSPPEADVREAIQQAQARTIFLRAGQMDYQDGKLSRIRPLAGPLPKGIDLHLVYNGTRALLTQLERVDETALADAINAAYQSDVARALPEQARVVGLQIDLDVPTRLLGRYEQTLRVLRGRLKPGTKLSITGLPTWMQSSDLRSTLAPVDFWIPQLYGAEIPERSDQAIPISSPNNIRHFVSQARGLDKPFYAGLAAYSYALLYSSSGALISLRGDMDPLAIASDPNLELIDQRPFELDTGAPGGSKGSEWRYVYRARADGVTDELAMNAGDVLVVDVPNAESLRLSAHIVREQAGARLLGICLFRLPGAEDSATLTISQVAFALADQDSAVEVEVRFVPGAQVAPVPDGAPSNWVLEVKNTGTAAALIGTVKVDLQSSLGTIESFAPQQPDSVEFLCATAGANNLIGLKPCSQRRANVIRFMPRSLQPGQIVRAHLAMNPGPPVVIPVTIEMQTDAGQTYVNRREVAVESRVKR